MSNSIKKYPLYHDTDNGTEGWDIYDAINHSPSGIYVDVPGLGLVEVTFKHAMDAMRRINRETGANQFALMDIGDDHPSTKGKPADHAEGSVVCSWGRILTRWA